MDQTTEPKTTNAPILRRSRQSEIPTTLVDPNIETLREFELRAHAAIKAGLTHIEAGDEIIDYLLPDGLGNEPFFHYYKPSIRVFRKGTYEAWQKKQDVMAESMKKEGSYFLGRT